MKRSRLAFVALAAVFLAARLAFGAGLPYPFAGPPSAPIPAPQDPSQLFSYINILANSINTNMLAGSGALSTQPTVNGGTSVNSIVASGANLNYGASPEGPGFAATGTDTNIDIVLTTKGQGVLLAGNPQMWIPAQSMIACPGYNVGSLGNKPFGAVNPYVQGYFMWADWLGRSHAVPGC